MKKLPKRLKAKWVKALRSGDFEQARGFLVGADGYCCLGVLGTICGVPINEMRGEGFLCNVNDEILGPYNSVVRGRNLERRLAAMNDNEKSSFKSIASYIERYL